MPSLLKNIAGKYKASWLPLLVALAAIAAFWPSLDNEFAVDDIPAIRDNHLVKQGRSAFKEIVRHPFYYGYDQRKKSSEYRPAASYFYAIEVSSFGISQPGNFHTVSLVLYALTGILVFFFLYYLVPHYLAALGGALLFVLHPLHSEVVANIKSQDELLHAIFLLSALLGWIAYLKNGKIWWLFFSILLYFLALCSKEQAYILILLFPLTDWFVGRSPKAAVRSWPYLLPFIIALAIRDTVIKGSPEVTVMNNALMYAPGWETRLAMGFDFLSRYVQLLIYPYPLRWDYSFNTLELHGWMHWRSFAGIGISAGLVALLVYGWKKKPLLFYGLAFFLLSTILYLHWFRLLEATFAERFMFLAVFLPALLFAMAIRFRPKFLWTGVLFLPFFFYLSFDRSSDWKNNLTLFTADLPRLENSYRAAAALAFEISDSAMRIPDEKLRNKKLEEANGYFTQSMSIYGKDPNVWFNFGMSNLGLGEYTMAEIAFKETITLKPDHTSAHNNMGNVQYLKGEKELAKNNYRNAVHYDPNNVEALSNLGAIFLLQKQPDSALFYLERAYRINPANEEVKFNLDRARARVYGGS